MTPLFLGSDMIGREKWRLKTIMKKGEGKREGEETGV